MTTACLIFFSSLSAQKISVTFNVTNLKKEPVPFATITVINRLDSLQSHTKEPDSSGVALFNLIKGGQYLVKITSINYLVKEKGIIVSGNQTIFSFIVEPLPKILENVKVTAQKPLIRQEDDKTIVDAESLAATSTSGYEVIEKTPGLFVDQDGNIYISSLSPATVQINGRDTRMSATDVAAMLKSLPPNTITRIEIVRTPSAKYDASGTGGIVNVVLRKGVKIGLTGSVNAGIQQGSYGNQFTGFSLNNNDGKKSSSLNVNYGHRNSFEQIKTTRLFAPDSMLSQDAYSKYPGINYYASYSLTYDLNKKWEITYDAEVIYNKFQNSSENENNIQKVSISQLLSNSLNYVNNYGNSLVLGTGLESKFKIDSMGSEWENDAWYSRTTNKSDQVFSTNYTSPFSTHSGGDGSADNSRDYINLKSDLKLKMKKKFTFETGMQVSIINFQNITNYFREINGIRSADKSRTNTFRYNQNINAIYLQGSKTLGKDLILKLGTRLENTNMKGRQLVPGDTSFIIRRTDLFPYIYLSKSVMKIMGYELRAYLVYRRTIRRPFYDQLNPFSRYIDQYLSEVGNPSLRPQFTRNYEANISVDERPILAIGVNDTKDIFTNVIYQSDTSRSQAYRTYDNLGKNKEWYLRGLGALPPGKGYFFVIGAQYNHNFYQGIYENKPLSFKKGTWTFFTYHSLRLDKKSQLTLNGFLRLKGQQQFYELTSFGALNASINRKFLKDKLIVTLSMNDIFYSNKNNFTISQGSISANGFRKSDTRRFGINFRYNFGIRKKEKEENNPLDLDSPEKNN
ncbi:MAG: TonB-dependent receptor domain-containing protein [Chitinophagaceae bacterium]